MFADRNALAAAEWAEKRRSKVERAQQIRMERSVGRIEPEHTFTPSTYESSNNSNRIRTPHTSSRGSMYGSMPSNVQQTATEQRLDRSSHQFQRKASFDSTGSLGLGYSKPTTSVGQQIASNDHHAYSNSAAQDHYSGGVSSREAPLYHDQLDTRIGTKHGALSSTPSTDSLTLEIQKDRYWPEQQRQHSTGYSQNETQYQVNSRQVPDWLSSNPAVSRPQYSSGTDRTPETNSSQSMPNGIYSTDARARKGASRASTAAASTRRWGGDGPESSPRRHGGSDDEMVFEFAATSSLLVSRNQSALVFSSKNQSQSEKLSRHPSDLPLGNTVPLPSRTRLSLLKDRLGSSSRRLRRTSKSRGGQSVGAGEYSLSSRRHDELHRVQGNRLERSRSANAQMNSFDNKGSGKIGSPPQDHISSGVSNQSKTHNKKVPCTRQSGCRCTQCNADASFQNMLRSSPKATKRKGQRRPEWNNDFSPPTVLATQESDGEETRLSQNQQLRATNVGARGSTNKQSRRASSYAPSATNERDDQFPTSNESPEEQMRVSAMRVAMGKKQDFIEQVHGARGSPKSVQLQRDPVRSASQHLSRSTVRSKHEQQSSADKADPANFESHRRRSQYRAETGQCGEVAEPSVGYRGMYRPERTQYNNTDPPTQHERRTPNAHGNYEARDSRMAHQPNVAQQPAAQRGERYTAEDMYNAKGNQQRLSRDYGNISGGQTDASGKPKLNSSGSATMVDPLTGEVVTEHSNVQLQLIECHGCGRKFKEASLQKHHKVCNKVFNSKRPTFNTAEARLSGVGQTQEDEEKLRRIARNGGARKHSPKKPKSKKWLKNSEKLREAMKYNRLMAKAKAEGKSIASLPPPPEDINEDYVQCPTCNRTFNPHAAERHIPKCKDQKARPKRLMRGSGHGAVSRR